MTEQSRTVAAERDLPRVRAWIEDAVRHAVNEAARAFTSIRYYCDQMEKSIERCRRAGYMEPPCSLCIERERIVGDIRRLLPAVSETSERRGSPAGGGDSSGNASDALRRRGRPGHVTPDP